MTERKKVDQASEKLRDYTEDKDLVYLWFEVEQKDFEEYIEDFEFKSVEETIKLFEENPELKNHIFYDICILANHLEIRDYDRK